MPCQVSGCAARGSHARALRSHVGRSDWNEQNNVTDYSIVHLLLGNRDS